MSWRDETQFDEPTNAVLEIAKHFLQVYFHHSPSQADQLLTDFFRQSDIHYTEEYICHEQAWSIAKQVHYLISIGGLRSDRLDWEVENNLRAAPREAVDYNREHWWEKYGRPMH